MLTWSDIERFCNLVFCLSRDDLLSRPEYHVLKEYEDTGPIITPLKMLVPEEALRDLDVTRFVQLEGMYFYEQQVSFYDLHALFNGLQLMYGVLSSSRHLVHNYSLFWRVNIELFRERYDMLSDAINLMHHINNQINHDQTLDMMQSLHV